VKYGGGGNTFSSYGEIYIVCGNCSLCVLVDEMICF
jgi:hypothetical protein